MKAGLCAGIFVLALAIACLLSMGLPLQAHALVAAQIEPTKVLFVGNSFTRYNNYGVAEFLEELAEANGKNVETKAITYGQAPLSSYALPSVETPARYTSLESALKKGTWDYVVLQEKSMYPITSPVEMHLSIGLLAEWIHELQPDAEVLLYMTHGFSNGTKYDINGTSRALTASVFEAYVQACYTDIGNLFDLRVVPAGMYFNRFAIVFPDISLVESDNKHPTALGFFIATCAFYEALYGERPSVAADDLDAVSVADQEAAISLLGVKASIEPTGLTLQVGQTAQLEASLGDVDDEGAGELDDEGDSTDTEAAESDGADAETDEGDSGVDTASESGEFGETDDPGESDEPDTPVFKSIDPNIATVDDNGLVCGVSEGTTAIVYEDSSGRRAACRVSVEGDKLLSAKLIFAENQQNLTVGDRVRVLPKVSGSLGAYSLMWFSGDTDVATVDALGMVEAKEAGSTVIVAFEKESMSMAGYVVNVEGKLKTPTGVAIKQKTAKLNGSSVVAMKLSWNAVRGAVGYQVYRRVGNAKLELIKETTSLTFIDKNPPTDKVLRYRIVAVSAEEKYNSDMSAVVRGANLSASKLTAVAKKRFVKLKWKKNALAKSYLVYRAPKGSQSFKLVAKVLGASTTTWKDKTVQSGKKYTYKIKCLRTVKGVKFKSMFSAPVTVKAKRKS